jgi:adenosylmethionine-8-amino-7-oxononanoate aminotransferase
MFPADLYIARRVWERALEHGVICRVAGANNVALCPPLIITKEQIDELVTTIGNAISSVAAEVSNDWKMASGK